MSEKLIVVGDLHGHWSEMLQYLRILRDHSYDGEILQIGDVGIGFGDQSSAEFFDDMFAEHQNMRFIRGNHDNPAEVKNSSHYIQDGLVEGERMFVGGGHSIDKEWRTPGLDWWEDEELSIEQFNRVIDTYLHAKPRQMFTHECPDFLLPLFPQKMLPIPSRTRQAFQAMWEAHKPELWVFGHFHLDFDQVIDGTRFICVNQYTVRRVDI